MELLDSEEAAEFLGVEPSTLYAYVSRGVLESVQDPEDARRRRYRKADLERLERRSEANQGHGAAAAGALDWGAPVLETAVSRISPVGPSYRGHRLRTLLDDGCRYEEVAELLWFGELGADSEAWETARAEVDEWLADISLPDEGPPADRFRHGLSTAALHDDQRFVGTRRARSKVARRIVWLLARLFVPTGNPAPETIADVLSSGLLDAPTDARRHAIETALIATAEHGLNASAFAGRVVASTGADPYACVTAAMSAMAGPQHGRIMKRAAELLSATLDTDDARQVVVDRVRGGDSLPGFGHRLYPAGDPRFDHLADAVYRATDNSEVPDAVDALVDAAADLDLPRPNLALALGMLTVAFDLPATAATGLFAIGRSAGWLAHTMEQYGRDQLLRPRARYVEEE